MGNLAAPELETGAGQLQDSALDPVSDELNRKQRIPASALRDLFSELSAQAEQVRDQGTMIGVFQSPDVEGRELLELLKIR